MRKPVGRARGQTLVETALVLPLFLMVLVGIVTLGIGVFYQQQLANVAREAARFAAVHSASSSCPTVSSLDPILSQQPSGYNDFCDPHEAGWPKMTTHAKGFLAGLPAASVHLAACWSGYVDQTLPGNYDAPPPGDYIDPISGTTVTVATVWDPCLIGGVDPLEDLSSVGCAPSMVTSDTASNLSDSDAAAVANRVTAYVCYRWLPPMAGFLLIPSEVVLRAASSEPIQRQQ